MAIAFDAATGSEAASTSLTYSHTCSGANRILFVAVNILSETDLITGITYSGVTMIQIDTQANVGNAERSYLYYLLAPATGANDVVVSSSGSITIRSASSSYTGARQSGVPDATAKQNDTTTPYSLAVTTVANNCWAVTEIAVIGESPTASTNVTERRAQTFLHLGDSNSAITPAGSFAQDWTTAVNRTSSQIHASFAPFIEENKSYAFFM